MTLYQLFAWTGVLGIALILLSSFGLLTLWIWR
jgi:hypothetical protein